MKDLFWGGLLIGIGLFNGASVFLGDFGWFNLLFDALGSYWIVRGLVGLVRGGGHKPADAPDGVHPGVVTAARQILTSIRENFTTPSVLEPADASDFRHLDLARYDAYQAAMQRRGFRCLGDFANTAVNHSPTSLIAPSILRVCVSAEGDLVVAYYQVKPRWGRRLRALLVGLLNLRWIAAPRDFAANTRLRQCADVETELDDGTFLITSNAAQAAMLTQPPSVQSDYHAAGTPLPELLSVHRARLGRALHGGSSKPVPVRSAGDMLNMQKRQAAAKIAYRESIHWVTLDELRGFAGGNAELAQQIHTEVRRQLRVEGGMGPGDEAPVTG